jgi:hypothetical protein
VLGGFCIAYGLINLVNFRGDEDLTSKLGVLLFSAGLFVCGLAVASTGIRLNWLDFLRHFAGILVVAGVILRTQHKGSLVLWCGGFLILALVVSFLFKLRIKREAIQTDQPR